MFILDKFEYLDETGQPVGREAEEQVRQMLKEKITTEATE